MGSLVTGSKRTHAEVAICAAAILLTAHKESVNLSLYFAISLDPNTLTPQLKFLQVKAKTLAP